MLVEYWNTMFATFVQKSSLVINFEQKHTERLFWCIRLCFEGQMAPLILSAALSVHHSDCPSICLSARLSARLTVCLFIHLLSVSLSVRCSIKVYYLHFSFKYDLRQKYFIICTSSLTQPLDLQIMTVHFISLRHLL